MEAARQVVAEVYLLQRHERTMQVDWLPDACGRHVPDAVVESHGPGCQLALKTSHLLALENQPF
jgi:hypothetical protein